MGKRSDFDRKDKDFYITPREPIEVLIPHLIKGVKYTDPCWGTGAIPNVLNGEIAECIAMNDLHTYAQFPTVSGEDATTFQFRFQYNDYLSKFFITNPPWTRTKKSGYLLHKIIENLASQKPTWLLFDSDWSFTKQSAPYMDYCVKMVAVGRVKWFPDSDGTGKDNCAWYLFDKNFTGKTEFIGR